MRVADTAIGRFHKANKHAFSCPISRQSEHVKIEESALDNFHMKPTHSCKQIQQQSVHFASEFGLFQRQCRLDNPSRANKNDDALVGPHWATYPLGHPKPWSLLSWLPCGRHLLCLISGSTVGLFWGGPGPPVPVISGRCWGVRGGPGRN